MFEKEVSDVVFIFESMFEDEEADEQMDISTIRLRRLSEALPYSR